MEGSAEAEKSVQVIKSAEAEKSVQMIKSAEVMPYDKGEQPKCHHISG